MDILRLLAVDCGQSPPGPERTFWSPWALVFVQAALEPAARLLPVSRAAFVAFGNPSRHSRLTTERAL